MSTHKGEPHKAAEKKKGETDIPAEHLTGTPKAGPRNDGFTPTPAPPADDPRASGQTGPVESFKQVKTETETRGSADPAAGGDAEAEVKARGEVKRTGPADKPKGTLFKVSVRNSFVRADGGVRAGSEDEAKKIFADYLTAGMECRETAE